MSKNLVIVESPPKCAIIKQYLGKEFNVIASYGHIQTLEKKLSAVDVDNNFQLHFQLNKDKKQVIKELETQISKANVVYLATDQDREGEAIAWSIHQNYLQDANKNIKTYRIRFNEITEQAIKSAINNPDSINQNLIESYKARVATDFLIGFNLSPIAWKYVSSAKSVGRVQTPALRLISETDNKIKNFTPHEYWKIETTHPKLGKLLLYKIKSELVGQTLQPQAAKNIVDELNSVKEGKIIHFKQSRTSLSSPLPFITSSLQRHCFNKLSMPIKDTMQIAQELYEGVLDKEEKRTSLITYMRTDSTYISPVFIEKLKVYFQSQPDYTFTLLKQKKSKKAVKDQEAHEAIRPTNLSMSPNKTQKFLNPKQQKVYTAIWNRVIQAYLPPAKYKNYTYEILVKQDYLFQNQTSELLSLGWKIVDNKEKSNVQLQAKLQYKVEDNVQLEEFHTTQHFTKPPAKINESSLVKQLESLGLGRPSTYSYILETLKTKNYITSDKGVLTTSELGHELVKFMVQQYARYINYDFTANLEKNLDNIAQGEATYLNIVSDFWTKLYGDIKNKLLLYKNCPKCKASLIPKLSKYGWYVKCDQSTCVDLFLPHKATLCPICNSYLILQRIAPKQYDLICCSCSHRIPAQNKEQKQAVYSGHKCSKCKKGDMVEKTNRINKQKFLACNRFPRCRNVESLPKS